MLIVYKLDRLARSVPDVRAITDRLVKAGADLASLTETINTRSALGKFFLTILAAFDELVREQIRERTSSGMRHHQKNGRRMGRLDRCPYGKMPDLKGPKLEKIDKETKQVISCLPARLIDCPEEQAVIERVLCLRAEGKGSKAIARALDDEGIACRGHRWNHSTVRAILRRSAATQR